MITVDKNHVSNLMLIEAYSEKHQTEEKINIFKKNIIRIYMSLNFKFKTLNKKVLNFLMITWNGKLTRII